MPCLCLAWAETKSSSQPRLKGQNWDPSIAGFLRDVVCLIKLIKGWE